MTIPLSQLIETAERSFADQLTEPAEAVDPGHTLREASARAIRSAALRGLHVAERLDPTPRPA